MKLDMVSTEILPAMTIAYLALAVQHFLSPTGC
jgi:hypothetical protein